MNVNVWTKCFDSHHVLYMAVFVKKLPRDFRFMVCDYAIKKNIIYYYLLTKYLYVVSIIFITSVTKKLGEKDIFFDSAQHIYKITQEYI